MGQRLGTTAVLARTTKVAALLGFAGGGPPGAALLAAAGIAGSLAGLLFSALTVGKQREVRTRQQAMTLLMSTIETARTEVPPVLDERLRDVRRILDERLLAAIEQREQELQQAIAEFERIAQQPDPEKQAAKAEALERRNELGRLWKVVEELRQELEALPAEPVHGAIAGLAQGKETQ
jgi:tetratricopeptide (TPR) repeat protein